MVLHANYDASYLYSPKSRSLSVGFLFLWSSTTLPSPLNCPLYCEYKLIFNVIYYASKAEIGALFANTKVIITIWTYIMEFCHPHPPPLQTYKEMAQGFSTKTIKKLK